MTLTEAQIEAIIKAGLFDASGMTDPDEVHDAAYDALVTEAPEVRAWDAEQDKGVYSVVVRGILGAYFVQAMEYDDDGVYSTLDEAIGAAEANYGEFFK